MGVLMCVPQHAAFNGSVRVLRIRTDIAVWEYLYGGNWGIEAIA
jgi:hypothetical protein